MFSTQVGKISPHSPSRISETKVVVDAVVIVQPSVVDVSNDSVVVTTSVVVDVVVVVALLVAIDIGLHSAEQVLKQLFFM